MAGSYPQVAAQPNLPEMEERILAFWEADKTFDASVEQHPRTSDATARTAGAADAEFVFYDGPPFANGLPHYGHLLTGFVKDAVPRYRILHESRQQVSVMR